MKLTTSILRHQTLKTVTRSMTSNSEPTVLCTKKNNATILTLNRPKKLNSLTLQMIHELDDGFKQGQANNSSVFILDGAGGKAFCAGGDVAAVRAAGLGIAGDKSLTRDFFFHEYRLNKFIGDVNEYIPQVSVWNGITMGGGVGVSIHGKFRICTEKTLFAKPETAIGLFPDVGASHFLGEMAGSTGEYIALTGARLKANDLMYSGLATHYLASEQLDDLYNALSMVKNNSSSSSSSSNSSSSIDEVRNILNTFQSNAEPVDVNCGIFGKHRSTIDQVFSKDSMEEIVNELKVMELSSKDEETKEFVVNTLKTLNSMSPTSLKITLEQVRRAKATHSMSLGECLKMEYRLCQTLMKNTKSDFYEGIRAVLVDKDRNPSWNPPTLEEVSHSDVNKHFHNLSSEEELHFDALPGRL
jgi:enoyl-CoA hydratase/carnithine racemase